MKNIFDKKVTDELVDRLNKLTIETQGQWGKMDVAQMIAHCNVSYELVYDNKHPKAKGLKKLMLGWFIKPIVVNEKPYKKNSPTAPQFKIVDPKVFETEKQRLSDYLLKTQELGENHFDGKESNSFGALTKQQWNNMFFKHLDHHLNQFGV